MVFHALLDPGDEVILGDPNYPGYGAAIEMAGGRPVYVPCGPDEGFRLTADRIRQAITPRTKAVLVVNPSNPGGGVQTMDELLELAELAQAFDLLVISDEIYERYVWEGSHNSFAALPGMMDRTITVGGFSKTFCMTGWRIGYIAGPPDFISAITEVRYAHSICAADFVQWGALEALQGDTGTHVAAITREFGERRQVVTTALHRLGIPHSRSEGGYFVMLAPKGLDQSGEAVAHSLLREAGLHTWPGAMFGTTVDAYVRIGLVHPVPVLETAVERLAAWRDRARISP